MLGVLLAATLFPSAPPAPQVESLFARVGPTPLLVARTPGQERAVVLIHGLGLAPFGRQKAIRAHLRDWQKPDSPLVIRLGHQADVYAFCFGQTAAVDRVADLTRLDLHLATLRAMGYKEIILIGHSAGGLIARYFVEDFPNPGVTRVIQVCSPNVGSAFAGLRLCYVEQTEFLLSLSVDGRSKAAKRRPGKRLPEGLEFVCVVGRWAIGSDGVVSRSSQWPNDLQRQGVVGYEAPTFHSGAMGNRAVIDLLDFLVRTPQPRSLRTP